MVARAGYLMSIVIFCEYRVERMAHRAERLEHSVICPGGTWTCTNPTGHCSCVATCGIKTINSDQLSMISEKHGTIDRRHIERTGLFSV